MWQGIVLLASREETRWCVPCARLNKQKTLAHRLYGCSQFHRLLTICSPSSFSCVLFFSGWIMDVLVLSRTALITSGSTPANMARRVAMASARVIRLAIESLHGRQRQ